MEYNNHNWQSFDFVSIFVIRKGFYNKKPPCFEHGNIPFIGASDSNNGITGFSDIKTIAANSKVGFGKNEPLESKMFPGNAICVTNNGSVGYAYYQAHPFTCTHDVNPLYLKERELNRYIAMFIIACIEKQRVCFTYARKWRPKRMIKSKLMLPIDNNGNPDWKFMEDYMREKEQQILKPTIEKLRKRLAINGSSIIDKPSNLRWKEFIFGDVFSIESTRSGIDKNKLIQDDGYIPYVTRTDANNGIDMFVTKQNDNYCVDRGNVITIGLDTQTVFYQPKPFYTGQNIQVVSHPQLDNYNAKFLIVAIKKLVERFSWGSYGASLSRLRRSRIFLPSNNRVEIDFEFMSTYMKNVEKNKLDIAIKILEKRLIDYKRKS